LAYVLFKKKAFTKPFGNDLRKPLCAGILRKWFKKEKPTLRWRMFSQKLFFENLFFKQKPCRNLNKGVA
jgi:hypothetical protein